MRKTYEPHNEKLASSIEKMEEAALSLGNELAYTSKAADIQTQELDDLQARIKIMAERLNFELPVIMLKSSEESSGEDLPAAKSDKPTPFRLDTLSEIDIAVTCVAGGLGVLIDFLVVKIPKSTNIVREGKTIHQSGSALTEWMRNIGFDKDGKTSTWVKTFEKWFGVNYDTSIIKGEKGFYPKTHRIYSLAHDPSPSGLLWAIKDMVTGTFSYIDKAGYLKIVPSPTSSPFKMMAAPIVWLGHLLSDIFTKAGLPLPGSCFLRTLQFGAFGEKKRTIGQVIEYMYIEGYDLRHLATMSLANACVEIIIRLYYILITPHVQMFARPAALIQVDKEMIRHKLKKMRLCGYSVAAAGNLAKLAVYKWNPTALNAPVWLALIRSALAELEYQTSTTKEVTDVMALRSEMESIFEDLQVTLSKL